MAKSKSKTSIQELLQITQSRRLDALLADRMDGLGAMVDAFITQSNTGTITNQWGDITVAMVKDARKTPVFYLDAAGVAFTALK